MENLWNEKDVYDFICQYVISLGYDKEKEQNIKNKMKYFQTYGTLANSPKIIGQIKTIEDIEAIIIKFYDISKEVLYSKSKTPYMIIYRRAFQYILKRRLGLTYARIAKHYKCNEETIKKNIRKVGAKIESDPIFRNEIIELKLLLR